jgi:hypothetical protein
LEVRSSAPEAGVIEVVVEAAAVVCDARVMPVTIALAPYQCSLVGESEKV